MKRLAPALLLFASACSAPARAPSDGDSVVLAREAMRAAAQNAAGPARSEPALRAVTRYRGEEDSQAPE